jgi:hypothetical protein
LSLREASREDVARVLPDTVTSLPPSVETAGHDEDVVFDRLALDTLPSLSFSFEEAS